MNYKKIYHNIIHRALGENRSKKDNYYENHHIIPRSLGGSDDDDNLVLLTAKEHFLCHFLLYKFTQGEEKNKMANAWFMMSRISDDQERKKINGTLYEIMKRAHAKSVSNFHSGKKLSDTQMEKRRKNPPNAKKVIINDIEFLSIKQASEHYNVSKVLIRQFIRGEISYEYLSDKDYRLKLKIEKQRKTLKENINKIPKNERTYAARYGEQKAKEIIEKQNKHKYNKKLSDETKKKISEAVMGRPAPNKGRKLSDETKKKMSEARTGRHISKNNYKLIDNEMNEYIIMKTGLREFFKRKFGGGVPSSIKRSLKTKEPVQRGRWKGWVAYVL